ncbi:MAG: tetratricopeptide repeat protein [Gemmatimonadaceae bacterium]
MIPRHLCRVALGLATLSVANGSALAQHRHASATAADPVPLYGNLGRHQYEITTANPQAQRYFNQGLRLVWAFNHAEAIRSFEEAERLDPSCAMCAWGVAFAYGPNINAGMDEASGLRAGEAIQRALDKGTHVTTRERALIDALATRYIGERPDQRAVLDSTWAVRIWAVADDFPDDQEAQVLYADALMNLSPWNYWTADGMPRRLTPEIIQRLERVLAVNPDHPGACHLYIHAVEARHPERALACAERLASLMPGAGHIVHMPGHIYIRVGRYADAITLNEHAVHADEAMLEGPGVARRGAYPNGYYPHNYHFLSFAASMTGMSEKAIGAARETANRLSVAAVKAVPWMESVTPVVQTTLVTFGRWKEILAEPLPGDSIPFLAAMTWYARGVAHAALGDEAAAVRDLERVRVMATAYPVSDNGTALRIAVKALEGEIALRGKRPKDAIGHFRAAVQLEDGLTYTEPPTWYSPMRHSLGVALLADRQFGEAERVYREDLERFPRNGWSLFGLAQALERQGKAAEARRARAMFAEAWKDADVKLIGSRF